MPLQSSTQLATLKIIGCPKSNYNTWVANNQVDENALYLVNEGDNASCNASMVSSKLVIINSGVTTGSGSGSP